MSRFLFLFSIVVLTACSATKVAKESTPTYETVMNGDEKILKGYINRAAIENDTTFAWFKTNMNYGQADAAAVEAFRDKADKFSMIVFGGTWCGDTQNLLPVFYRLVDKSGYPESKITLIGVDRTKQAIDDLHVKYNVTNVPTFIVIKPEGQEAGRVVEYGKLGQVDKELGEIVKAL